MRWSYALVVCVVVGVFSDGSARAGVTIVSQSASVDRAAGAVDFTLRLDRRPDLWTVDEFGRVADSFQYEIDGDWRAPLGLPPEGLNGVVRGDEVRFANALRIRGAGPAAAPDPDPAAGGWGAVRAEVPFSLDGGLLRFRAKLEALGDDGDGYFAYRVFTTEFGLTTSEVESRLLPPGVPDPTDPNPGDPGPVTMPLPPALASTAAAAGGAVLVLGARRLFRRRHHLGF